MKKHIDGYLDSIDLTGKQLQEVDAKELLIMYDIFKCSNKIEPFRMIINKEDGDDGFEIISYLTRCGIGMAEDFNQTYDMIIYDGSDTVTTTLDSWVFLKKNKLKTISYNDFKSKYSI